MYVYEINYQLWNRYLSNNFFVNCKLKMTVLKICNYVNPHLRLVATVALPANRRLLYFVLSGPTFTRPNTNCVCFLTSTYMWNRHLSG